MSPLCEPPVFLHYWLAVERKDVINCSKTVVGIFIFVTSSELVQVKTGKFRNGDAKSEVVIYTPGPSCSKVG